LVLFLKLVIYINLYGINDNYIIVWVEIKDTFDFWRKE